MTKLFLHIGMEKTGSTALQTLLGRNRAALSEAGVHFPKVKKAASNHNFLASSYMAPASPLRSRVLSKLGSPDQQSAHLESVRNSILANLSANNKVIISGEHFFRLTAKEIAALANDLAKYGVTDCRVFGVLREPASFYLSAAQQQIKGSSSLLSIDFQIPYADRVAAWRERFDAKFISFHTARTSSLGLINTFLQEIVSFLGPLPNLPEAAERANETLSGEEMQIVQDFRRTNFPNLDGMVNRDTDMPVRLLKSMRDESWKRPELSPAVSDHIRLRYLPETERLFSLTGLDLSAPIGQAQLLDPSSFRQSSDILANFDSALHREILSLIAFDLIREPLYRFRWKWRQKKSQASAHPAKAPR